jgi:hypothetical protein
MEKDFIALSVQLENQGGQQSKQKIVKKSCMCSREHGRRSDKKTKAKKLPHGIWG